MTGLESLRRWTAAIALLVVLCTATGAGASTIQFVHSGTGSGLLDGVAFGSTEFTITGLGDSSNITSPSSGVSLLEHDLATISISGLGEFTFGIPTLSWFNDNINTVGFGTTLSIPGFPVGPTDLYIGPMNIAGLEGWDMMSAIGPLSGSGQFPTTTVNPWFALDILVIDDTGAERILRFNAANTTAGFSGGEIPAIPLPAALPLLLSGIALLGFIGWSRRRQTASA